MLLKIITLNNYNHKKASQKYIKNIYNWTHIY